VGLTALAAALAAAAVIATTPTPPPVGPPRAPAAATLATAAACSWRQTAAELYAALGQSSDPAAVRLRASLAAAGADQPGFGSACGPAPAPGSTAGAGGGTCPTDARPYFPRADWLWSPIPSGAQLDPASTAMAGELASGDHILNTGEFGVALVNADEVTASTPRSAVPLSENWGPDPLAGIQVPVPANLQIPPGSDGHVAIADPTTDTVVNLWVAKKTGTGLAANWGAATPLDGDGREHSGSSTGAGIARYAAVVRAQEIADGNIGHALFFSTNVVKPGEVRYPATKTDGSNMDGAGSPIPEGARVQLDPSIDVDAIPGISKGAATIAKALQTYGAYVGDNGGARMAFIAEYAPGSNAYEQAGLSGDFVNLNAIPWDKLRVLADWSGGTAATPADPAGDAEPSSANHTPEPTTEPTSAAPTSVAGPPARSGCTAAVQPTALAPTHSGSPARPSPTATSTPAPKER
jgi:hypothetical protein